MSTSDAMTPSENRDIAEARYLNNKAFWHPILASSALIGTVVAVVKVIDALAGGAS